MCTYVCAYVCIIHTYMCIHYVCVADTVNGNSLQLTTDMPFLLLQPVVLHFSKPLLSSRKRISSRKRVSNRSEVLSSRSSWRSNRRYQSSRIRKRSSEKLERTFCGVLSRGSCRGIIAFNELRDKLLLKQTSYVAQ